MTDLVGGITGLVGLAVLGGVAVKTIDVVGQTLNQGQPQKKKMKKKSNNNIFDIDLTGGFTQKKSAKKSNNADNIFSMGF